ncbi:hypothetical protein HY524_01390 [Candidatus Berkelbacteria bacterium]|nr:hypothetical protein [Candidatus Berkelbacteria bacterium]
MGLIQRAMPLLVGTAFLLFILAYTLYSLYAVHHLNEFGYSGETSQRMLRMYIGFTAIVIVATLTAIGLGLLTQ